MSYMLSCVLQADWGEERCQSMYVNQIHVEREAEASGKSKLLEPPYSTTRSLLLHRIKRWENFFVFFVFAKPRLVHGIKNFYLSSWWLYVISVDLKGKFFLFFFFAPCQCFSKQNTYSRSLNGGQTYFNLNWMIWMI